MFKTLFFFKMYLIMIVFLFKYFWTELFPTYRKNKVRKMYIPHFIIFFIAFLSIMVLTFFKYSFVNAMSGEYQSRTKVPQYKYTNSLLCTIFSNYVFIHSIGYWILNEFRNKYKNLYSLDSNLANIHSEKYFNRLLCWFDGWL